MGSGHLFRSEVFAVSTGVYRRSSLILLTTNLPLES